MYTTTQRKEEPKNESEPGLELRWPSIWWTHELQVMPETRRKQRFVCAAETLCCGCELALALALSAAPQPAGGCARPPDTSGGPVGVSRAEDEVAAAFAMPLSAVGATARTLHSASSPSPSLLCSSSAETERSTSGRRTRRAGAGAGAAELVAVSLEALENEPDVESERAGAMPTVGRSASEAERASISVRN